MLSTESIYLLNDIQNLFYTIGFLSKFGIGMTTINELTSELKGEVPRGLSVN